MGSNGSLDSVDLQILDLLQDQGRITNAQLAREVGLSPPSVLERVRKLEERGVIQRYVALVDPPRVGHCLTAYVLVSLAFHRKDSIDRFRTEIQGFDEVLECYHVSGEGDYLLRVVLPDIEAYRNFLMERLTPLEVVQTVRTMIVFETLKHETKLNLNRPD